MAAQLVADIIHNRVAEVKRSREAARKEVARRRQRGRAWYFLVALPMLLGLTVWNAVRAQRAPEVFTAEERESTIRLRMYLAVEAVESYHRENGRWPADLRTIGMGDVGFLYVRQDSVYAISDTSAAVPLTYRRGDPLRPFAEAYQELKHASRSASL